MMRRILALLAERRVGDHRAVFHEFALRLAGVLRPARGEARVRAVSR